MTLQEAKSIIENKKECVERNKPCMRICEHCDLFVSNEDMREAYSVVLGLFDVVEKLTGGKCFDE